MHTRRTSIDGWQSPEIFGIAQTMIKNAHILKKHDDLFRNEKKSAIEQSLELFTAMWNEGIAFGVLPPSDPWEGVDVDVRIAGILNACLTKSLPD
jgi:lipoprotein signal peptidase